MMKLTDLVVVIFLLNLINLNLIDLKFNHIILALLSSIPYNSILNLILKCKQILSF